MTIVFANAVFAVLFMRQIAGVHKLGDSENPTIILIRWGEALKWKTGFKKNTVL